MCSWYFCRLPLCLDDSVFCHAETFQSYEVCLLIVDLSAGANSGLFRKSLLCHWVQGYSLLPLLSGSEYLVSCWGLWSIWSWILCRMIDMELCGFLYIQFDKHCLLEMLSFPVFISGFFIKKASVHRSVCELMSVLSIWFHWSHFWFCVSTVLFVLLKCCSRVWSWEWPSPDCFLEHICQTCLVLSSCFNREQDHSFLLVSRLLALREKPHFGAAVCTPALTVVELFYLLLPERPAWVPLSL